ncbi:hypothetical protein A616_16880 [Brevibacillus brevis X23]|nr:hypothetical protein A616_16880 [Brevibacillus brevis X23]
MKVEEWIINELEHLEGSKDTSLPQYIMYRSGVVYEMILSIKLKLENKDDMLVRANNLFMEYMQKVGNKYDLKRK